MATLVPTFDEKQEFFDIKWAKKPAMQGEFGRGKKASDFHFVFILDLRSKLAINGLAGVKRTTESFLNAIPQGSSFSVMGLSAFNSP